MIIVVDFVSDVLCKFMAINTDIKCVCVPLMTCVGERGGKGWRGPGKLGEGEMAAMSQRL